MTNTSYIGLKWEIKGNSEGNIYKQNKIEKDLHEKLKKNQEEWNKNIPQLKFPKLK